MNYFLQYIIELIYIMNGKLNDIKTAHNKLFADCKQGRRRYAGILPQKVLRYNNRMLAINEKWDAGKPYL